MDLENAIAAEVSRLHEVAGLASREIVANRPWWAGALSFLRMVLL